MKSQVRLVANLDTAYMFHTPTQKAHYDFILFLSYYVASKSFLHKLTLPSSVGWPFL